MEVTLITGASGGICEALAQQLAARKHNLLLVARNEAKLKELSQELTTKFRIVAPYIPADLSKAESPAHIFAQTNQRGLIVSTLINNAGIGSGGEFAELPLQGELDMMQLNMGS